MGKNFIGSLFGAIAGSYLLMQTIRYFVTTGGKPTPEQLSNFIAGVVTPWWLGLEWLLGFGTLGALIFIAIIYFSEGR